MFYLQLQIQITFCFTKNKRKIFQTSNNKPKIVHRNKKYFPTNIKEKNANFRCKFVKPYACWWIFELKKLKLKINEEIRTTTPISIPSNQIQ